MVLNINTSAVCCIPIFSRGEHVHECEGKRLHIAIANVASNSVSNPANITLELVHPGGISSCWAAPQQNRDLVFVLRHIVYWQSNKSSVEAGSIEPEIITHDQTIDY